MKRKHDGGTKWQQASARRARAAEESNLRYEARAGGKSSRRFHVRRIESLLQYHQAVVPCIGSARQALRRQCVLSDKLPNSWDLIREQVSNVFGQCRRPENAAHDVNRKQSKWKSRIDAIAPEQALMAGNTITASRATQCSASGRPPLVARRSRPSVPRDAIPSHSRTPLPPPRQVRIELPEHDRAKV